MLLQYRETQKSDYHRNMASCPRNWATGTQAPIFYFRLYQATPSQKPCKPTVVHRIVDFARGGVRRARTRPARSIKQAVRQQHDVRNLPIRSVPPRGCRLVLGWTAAGGSRSGLFALHVGQKTSLAPSGHSGAETTYLQMLPNRSARLPT
jgi:hypothetical protein